MVAEKKFLEFFAGGGFARLGLGDDWKCLFANDFDSQKCAAYRANFGDEDLHEGDVADLTIEDLPADRVDLAWASFPCQDLSLAGARGGLGAARSNAFFPFWRLMSELARKQKAPKTVVIENVPGLLTSNGGRDFALLVETLADTGYTVSAMLIDARHFSPQSRQRIFIFGFAPDVAAAHLFDRLAADLAPEKLRRAVDGLPARVNRAWRWIAEQPATLRNSVLADLIEHNAPWDSEEKTLALIDAMKPRHRKLIESLKDTPTRSYGSAFKRIRTEQGEKRMRVEARFDGVAGCLRTPAGGSSRQIVLAAGAGEIHSRLMTPREAARLMGAPDEYQLPEGVTAALKLCGDGVSVPVVQWVGENILTPALAKAHAAA